LLGALGSTAALVAIYYLLPLDRSSIGVVIGILAVGLLALIGLVAFQVRAIIRAAYPALRAVGALATSVPLFLLLFAGTYFVMGTISAGTFSQPMTRTDALYFTVTVFSTVGFGDITAVTEAARLASASDRDLRYNPLERLSGGRGVSPSERHPFHCTFTPLEGVCPSCVRLTVSTATPEVKGPDEMRVVWGST
jgi:hypothetical protein